MKILHINNVAGVATQLRNTQRRLGHNSDILVFGINDLQYDYDYVWSNNRLDQFPTPIAEGVQIIENLLQFQQLISEYDILHFHAYTIIGGNIAPTRPPQGMDLPLWKLAGKTIIKHHHGSDIRYRGCPYFQKKFADVRLVSTPDLIEWDPEAELTLNPIVADDYEYVGVKELPNSEPVTIVHAPTDREKKGTESVIDAVENLQKQGVSIELKVVENVPNEEAIEMYKQADIIADQFRLGWYGVFSIEAMCLGKPVLAYIRDEYKEYTPDIPIVDTPINKLEENIRLLAQDFELRKRLGEKGRKFIEERHNAEKVAKKVIGLYKED